MDWAYFHSFGGMMGEPILMMPMMLLVFAGLAVLAWLAFRAPAPQPGDGAKTLDILRERFARGEIDQKEFDARREALSR